MEYIPEEVQEENNSFYLSRCYCDKLVIPTPQLEFFQLAEDNMFICTQSEGSKPINKKKQNDYNLLPQQNFVAQDLGEEIGLNKIINPIKEKILFAKIDSQIKIIWAFSDKNLYSINSDLDSKSFGKVQLLYSQNKSLSSSSSVLSTFSSVYLDESPRNLLCGLNNSSLKIFQLSSFSPSSKSLKPFFFSFFLKI